MAERSAGQAVGRAPRADRPDVVRNVALVGPSGGGKTTLLEHLLAAHGVVARPGSVESGTTVSDSDEAEHRQLRSVGVAFASYAVKGLKVNVVDTPGYADFVGELRAGLRAADCALFVVSAAEPLDGATAALWRECDAVAMPRAVVVTKLDHPRADFAGTLSAVQAAFGNKAMPIYLPVDGATALVGLLSGRVYDHSAGPGDPSQRSPDSAEQALVDEHRGPLIEAVIEESEDETLMDRYLDGQDIDLDTLIGDLEQAVAGGTFFPVLATAAPRGLGLVELDEVIAGGFPAPAEHPLPPVFTVAGARVEGVSCDAGGPLLAEVVKTTSDPYLGRVSVVRMFSGTLRPDAAVHVSGHSSAFRSGGGASGAPVGQAAADGSGDASGHVDHDEDQGVGALSAPLGAAMRPVDLAVAGDIVAIARLSRAETGDTLSDPARPLVMEPWTMPEPLLPMAVVAHARSDEDKLSAGLGRLAAEDIALRVEHNPDTRQLVLWTMGESHAEVLLDRLATRHGVRVDRVDVEVPMRETFARPGKGHGRHVKQSGGHGQFAVCDIEVEPLPSGAGFEFADRVVGGAVPRQFIPSVEKGIVAAMKRGVASRHPLVDVKVTLVDGKAHSVDSSDMAFQTAAGLALRDAAQSSAVTMLEPVDDVRVLVADEHVGAVMGDLSSRRARVLGSEMAPDGRTVVHAEVPAVELVHYATQLRSISHGTGSFQRGFARFDPAPHP